MMAGMAVGASDPSGLLGMLQEGFATGSALVHAETDLAVNRAREGGSRGFRHVRRPRRRARWHQGPALRRQAGGHQGQGH